MRQDSNNLRRLITANRVSVRISSSLGVEPSLFETPFIYSQLDMMQWPIEWLHSTRGCNNTHLLSFPFIFPQKTLVSCFRAINLAKMLRAHEDSQAAEKLNRAMNFTDLGTHRGNIRLEERLGAVKNSFLLLKVRREHILTDTLDQLWRRERHELMKPLRVRIEEQGKDIGQDEGGVQKEFMHVVAGELIMPDYGITSNGYLNSAH